MSRPQLPKPVRRAIQVEMAALVKHHGSQTAVAAEIDLAPFTVGRAEKQGIAGPLVLEKLLAYLKLDEAAFFARHEELIATEEMKLAPRAVQRGDPPQSQVQRATNNLAIATSSYTWHPKLSSTHRELITRQIIEGREQWDRDLPVEEWTQIIAATEARIVGIAADLAKMEAAEKLSRAADARNDDDSDVPPPPTKRGRTPPAATVAERRRGTGTE